MKALLVILALAGVAVASEMEPMAVAPEHETLVPENVPGQVVRTDAVVPEHVLGQVVRTDAVVPEHVPGQVVRTDAVETPVVPAILGEVRHIPIYGLPKVEANMYERLSMRAIHNKPLYLVVRMGENKELELFMLKNGFESILNDPKFEYLAKHLMTGPEKVGLLHSAALAMQIPDLHYTIGNIRISSDVNPLRAFQIEMDVITPWVFIIPKSELPVVPEKLFEIGTFQVRNNGIMVAREFTPAVNELTRTRYLPVEGIAQPLVRTEDGVLGHYRTHGLHHELQRGLQREPVFETENGFLKAHSLHHDLQRGLQREPVFETEDGFLKAHSLHHDLQRGLQREPVFETEEGVLRAHSLHHGPHHDVHIPYAYRHTSPAYTPLMIRGVPSYFTV